MRMRPFALLAAATLVIATAGSAGAVTPAPFGPLPTSLGDLYTGSPNGNPTEGVALGDKLVFTANSIDAGSEPWISDGTLAGTHLLKDIAPGDGGSLMSHTVAFKGKVFFTADDSTSPSTGHGEELWVTDGTSAGTHIVKDINTGAAVSSSPANLTVVGSTLYFTAGPPGFTDSQLWKTDGTANGTVEVLELAHLTSSEASSFTAWGNELIFSADADGTHADEPWVSDGTGIGTHPITSLAGTTDALATDYTPVGSTVFFTATDTAHGTELWKTDGTAPGTKLVRDIRAGSSDSFPLELTKLGDGILFDATTTDGTELWTSDGTKGGTEQVKDINETGDADIDGLIPFAGKVYFGAEDGAGYQLWATGGSATTTKKVSNFPGDGFEGGLAVVGGRLFMDADTASDGAEPAVSDGTPAGTHILANLSPGSGDSEPEPFGIAGNTVFFKAKDGTHGNEPYAWTSRTSKTSVAVKSSYSKSIATAKKISVTVTVKATSTTPTGKITLKKGSTVIGSGTLKGGKATIRITVKLGKGTTSIKAYYSGSVRAQSSTSATAKIKVA